MHNLVLEESLDFFIQKWLTSSSPIPHTVVERAPPAYETMLLHVIALFCNTYTYTFVVQTAESLSQASFTARSSQA